MSADLRRHPVAGLRVTVRRRLPAEVRAALVIATATITGPVASAPQRPTKGKA